MVFVRMLGFGDSRGVISLYEREELDNIRGVLEECGQG